MEKHYLGVDIGSISTKGVIIDENEKIIRDGYIWTEGDPVGAVKRLIKLMDVTSGSLNIVGAGTTGSARKLAGVLLNADLVKNEITAHAVGTLSLFPDARTILEIGGQDSKIILIDGGIVSDYAMNTLCAAGTGSFLSSQAKRLGVEVEEFGELALRSDKPASIAARCTVFAESDLVHKAQIGYKKEDIIAGLCNAVVTNFLNNLAKGKKIRPPVVFQGGVSKNAGVVRAFENALGEKVYVDANSHLAGALGMAVLCKNSGVNKKFNSGLIDCSFEIRGDECGLCPNKCEIIKIYRDNILIDVWGSRCGNITAETAAV